MRKLLHLSTAMILAGVATPAIANDYENSGWYLRGNAGYGAHTDAEFDQSIFRGDIESEGNVAGSLGIGYQFDNNWRVELDGDTLWTDMGRIGQQDGSFAKLRTNTLMLNAIYDLADVGDRFIPYVGAGVGLVQGQLDAQAHDFIQSDGTQAFNPACIGGQSGSCAVSDKDMTFGAQLLAGLGYAVSDNLTWDTHYTYMMTESGGLDFDGSFAPSLSNIAGFNHALELQDVGAHSLMTGLRYRFGAAAPKKVMSTCWDGSQVESLSNCPSRPAPEPTRYTCWDGSTVLNLNNCPAEPAPEPTTYSCWDGSTVLDLNNCPARPAPQVTCWDGSLVSDAAFCPTQQVVTQVQPYNDCGPSNVAIFNVPLDKQPKQMDRLGTMPEFGDSHGLTPDQFFQKLQRRYSESKVDRAYLDYLFKSMGYSNGFSDAQSYMFSEEVLPVGTRGILGLGEQHHYNYSILPSNDRDRQAFRIQSANGSVIHFMKTCGNYMYACN